jgi:plasmid stabilization system protein ParE
MNVLLGEAAKIELENAIEWYELQSQGLGRRFAQAIDITVKRLLLYPEISPILVKEIRRAMVKGFPYGIIYSLKDEYIEIISVAHSHRKPMYWEKRIK